MSVAVVTPVYRAEVLPAESVSLRHLRKYLSQYDWWQVSPESLDFSLDGFKIQKFPDTDFASVDSYSKLLLAPRFYEAFADYDHVLIYQLDCLVCSDELDMWCGRGFDYVGAPLFRLKADPDSGFSGACNGGLSLRKVNSFLTVLNSRRYLEQKVPFLADVFREPFIEARPAGVLATWRKRFSVARQVRGGVRHYTTAYSLNEDHFWSGRAAYFYPAFNMAPPEVALSFAFEAAPEACFERNGRKMPFGAHAWQKWNRGFWEPHLLRN